MAHSINKCVIQVKITVKLCNAKNDIKMLGIWIGPHSSHYCTIAFGAMTGWCNEDGDWHDDYDTML